MSAITIVEPTGVPAKIEITIPVKAHITEIITEHRVTLRKFLKTRIADKAGKTIRAEINNEPARFIARTITTADITAISKLYKSVLTPETLAKFSSNVTAKILLYERINTMITITDRTEHKITSFKESVSIETEPNSVVQTSPERFDEAEKIFMTM